jgi:hypothetical protein
MVGERVVLGSSVLRVCSGAVLCAAFLGTGYAPVTALALGKPDEAKTEVVLSPERKQQDPLLQLIRALTPEQKSRLMESIKTWQQLGPELKTALRARDKVLRKTLNDEVQVALEGTAFTKEQRDLFEKRYREERKKLETSLRTEFEARRKGALDELVNSLKKSLIQGDVQ